MSDPYRQQWTTWVSSVGDVWVNFGTAVKTDWHIHEPLAAIKLTPDKEVVWIGSRPEHEDEMRLTRDGKPVAWHSPEWFIFAELFRLGGGYILRPAEQEQLDREREALDRHDQDAFDDRRNIRSARL